MGVKVNVDIPVRELVLRVPSATTSSPA